MTPSAREVPGVHPTALLLPWYLSGQLSEAERGEVERHLQSCDACRTELESLTVLRTQLKQAQENMPGPSARVRSELFRRLDARRAPRAIWTDRLAEGLRLLLSPKWAPALVVLVIAGQFGALGWLAMRPGPQSQIQARGLPASRTRLRIVFNPAAPERNVAAALHELGAHFVDGPAADGAYIVELSPGSPSEIAARVRSLRERRDVVEQVDLAPP